MKPAPFDYAMPTSLEDAVALLADGGEETSVLAGGQSLVPLMNLRLARPTLLVDIGSLAGLRGIANGDGLRIGATTTQASALTDPAIAAFAPLLTDALRHVGHPASRSRGTVGGSLAHADPAAELPAVMVALGGSIAATSTRGTRSIAAPDLVTGPFTTSLRPDELLTEIRIPADAATRNHGFAELARRSGDFALAGACCTAVVAKGVFLEPRIVLFGLGPGPVRAHDAEAALDGASCADASAIEAAAAAAAAACDPADDIHASAAYRRRAAAVVTRRALAQMGGEGG
jgi:carbon-monoxide dehydrogenase medium subunit